MRAKKKYRCFHVDAGRSSQISREAKSKIIHQFSMLKSIPAVAAASHSSMLLTQQRTELQPFKLQSLELHLNTAGLTSLVSSFKPANQGSASPTIISQTSMDASVHHTRRGRFNLQFHPRRADHQLMI